MSSQDNGERLGEGAILGAAMGVGYQAIKSGKDTTGLLDGALSGRVLGGAWRGLMIASDKSGLTEQVNKAKDKILNR